MNILVNLWAVLGAAVAMMIVGSLWYGPIFGKAWMKLTGMTRADMRMNNSLPAWASMAFMFVAALVTSYILGYFITWFGAATEGDAVLVAVWAWLGFVATTLLTPVLFERRKFSLYLIAVFQYLVSFVIAAIILAHWPA